MSEAVSTIYDTAMEIALISLGDIDGMSRDELEYRTVERALRFVPLLDSGSDAYQSIRYVSMSDDVRHVVINAVEENKSQLTLKCSDASTGELIEFTTPPEHEVLGQAAIKQARSHVGEHALVTVGSAPGYAFDPDFVTVHRGCAVWVDCL